MDCVTEFYYLITEKNVFIHQISLKSRDMKLTLKTD